MKGLVLTACLMVAAAPVPQGSREEQRPPGEAGAPGAAVRLLSPDDGTYVSGAITLRAEIAPAEAIARVLEAVFWVDGRVVCRLAAPPLQCQWDAGPGVEAHQIRVVVRFAEGRVSDSVQTKALDLTEVVHVDAVQVTTVVTDREGRFVRGLPREAFHVYEDEVPQKIAHFASDRIPLELTTAVDISGSMKAVMDEVKAAARRFLSALDPEHQVAVLAFNDNLFELAPRGADPRARLRAVDRLAAWGSTALYDAILHGIDLLGRQPGRRALVVFTDGDDRLSHATMQMVVRRVESSDATLYMIGQGQATDSRQLQALLTHLANLSGGRAFFETQVERLAGIFDEILDDLSNQYLLSYQPSGAVDDDRWRAIRVEVDGPGYRVRARQGYRR